LGVRFTADSTSISSEGEKGIDRFKVKRSAEPARSSETSIEELEKGLLIDEHALDEALLRQPDAFYRVSKRLAIAISERDYAKQALEEEEARADAHIRESAALESKGDKKEKLTGPEVKALVALDKDVLRASKQLLHLRAQVGMWQALKEAFNQRSYALKDLVTLHAMGYFGETGNSRATNLLKDREAANNKEEMRRARERARHERR
jgi:hypothetical protein